MASEIITAPREEKIQDRVRDVLLKHDLIPYSVIYTYEIGSSTSGTLGITMYMKDDLIRFAELLDYKYRCDKGGFLWFWETNTVLLSGNVLLSLAL